MRGKKRKLKYCIFTGVLLSIAGGYTSRAQEHIAHRREFSSIRLAEEQYGQGHYLLAMQSAGQYLQSDPGACYLPGSDHEKAKYLLTLTSLKLDMQGAEDSAISFIHASSSPAYQQRASFTLAQYYFKHERLSQAIPFYESAGISNLTNQEIADSKFELAYCYFNNKQFDRATPLFASIKEVQGKYYVPSNYYYGLLAYNNNSYAEALESFKRIENEAQYSPIVPYYIAEIHYFSGDKAKALEEAVRLTKKPEKLFYDNELHLLAAQVLFEDQRYGEALPYFEYYYEHVEKIRKEELYEMAYSYYRTNAWTKAIDKFKQLSNTKDSLGQTAMYLLGDCYLKTGNKKSARNAFGICADMSYNAGQQEAALFLYAKLSYELGYNDEALRSFKAFLNRFPHSSFTAEAKTLLSDLYTRTNNYAEAYEALKDVAGSTEEYRRISQKVSYGYAIQQLQTDNLIMADNLLSASLKNPADPYYEAAAYFWRGDIAYKQNKAEAAKNYLSKYISLAGKETGVEYVSPQANLTNAYLDLGYVSMQLEDFSGAQSYFAQAEQSGKGNGTVLSANAAMGQANAAFMQKNYSKAGELYDRVIAMNSDEADYARLQKAILAGIQGKNTEKINQLQQITRMQPPSPYADDAAYELGLTYIEADKYQQAIAALQPLTAKTEGKNLASKAWIRIGFAYQQLDNDAKAIEAYKHVLMDYPSSDDRAAALAMLRSLYVENNQPGAYTSLLQSLNLPAEGAQSMDTTYYAAAEAQFAAGKYENAKTSFGQYLDKYPAGAFVTKAYYYKAESHYQLKEYPEALKAYEALLALPWSEFTENSARRAGQINYQNGEFTAAIADFQQLRNTAMGKDNLQLAYNGLMKSNFSAGNFEQASSYADTLLTMPELSPNVQADVQFFKAKSLQRQTKLDEALGLYKQLGTGRNDAIASEAKYHIAEIYLQQEKLAEAEAAAGEAIKLNTGNDYWVVKSYLLITEILIRQKDYFNAKATLQSIIKNTKNAELKREASQKMEQVKAMEKEQTKLKEE